MKDKARAAREERLKSAQGVVRRFAPTAKPTAPKPLKHPTRRMVQPLEVKVASA